MKRLLDSLLSRWYVPNEVFANAVSMHAHITPPSPEYIELKPGCYWPIPETRTMMRARCS